jgi:hypothetical protein
MRTVGSIAFLVVVVGLALAADLATEVAGLDQAMEARITAIGTPATPALKKEAKQLGKGRKILGNYTGTNDIGDLKVLGKAGKKIDKSGTTDTGILTAVGNVLLAAIEIVETQQGLAADAAALLANPTAQAKVNAALAKADQILGDAKALLQTDPAKAIKLLIKAWKQYGKALLKAQSGGGGGGGGGSEPNGLPPNVTVTNDAGALALRNASKKPYYITEVYITGTVSDYPDGNTVATPSGARATSFAGQLFDGFNNQVFAIEDPSEPVLYTDLFPFLSEYRKQTTGASVLQITGNLYVTISKKNDGKSTWATTIILSGRLF